MSTHAKQLFFFTLLAIFFLYTVYIINDEGEGGAVHYSKTTEADGRLVFQRYNCISCHQLYGLGGYMGPDLTNVISAKGKGSDYTKAFLRSGSLRMPDFNLSEDEIDALAEYLAYVDRTGKSPQKKFQINIDGTVTYDDNR